MDELDHNLLVAWHRVFEKCRRDPVEARRRYERTLPGTALDRPVRAWCVALRASDTRLLDYAEVLAPSPSQGEGWDEGGACDQPRPTTSSQCEDNRPPSPRPSPFEGEGGDPVRAQEAHEIVLDGAALRQLGGAVRIPYPGVPIDEAAKLLGKHREALRDWLPHRPGRTRGRRAEGGKGRTYDDTLKWLEVGPTKDRPLGVQYVPQATMGRHFGMETPVVWSDVALDPGAAKGRPPAHWWGTLWQSLAERIPYEFEQVVERVPRFVPYPEIDGRKRPRFRGWWWVCPGMAQGVGSRPLGVGERQDDLRDPPTRSSSSGCGRFVQTLYAPLPVWTVGRHWGITEGLKVDGLSGQWLPGVMDRWAGRRSLACERCWRLRRTSFSGYRGWNELVTHLSGGLLYGHEVEKPSDFEYERRRAYAKRRRPATSVGSDMRAITRQSSGSRLGRSPDFAT